MLTLLVVNQNLPEPAQNAHRAHSLQKKEKENKQTNGDEIKMNNIN